MTPTPETLAAKVLMTCDHADPLAANPGKWAVCVDCVIGLLTTQAREIERLKNKTAFCWLVERTADLYIMASTLAELQDNPWQFDDAAHALRFARKIDAETFIIAANIRGCRAVEHGWLP